MDALRLLTQVCFICMLMFWGLYFFGFQDPLNQIMLLRLSELEQSVAETRASQSASAVHVLLALSGEGADVKPARRWGYDDVSAELVEALPREYKFVSLPLDDLNEEFLAGRATLFILTFRQGATNTLNGMGGTECQPNMRVLEWLDEEWCNQLFNLLHKATFDPAECGGLTGWDNPFWETLDCLPWIFSYSYEQNCRELPDPIRARLERAFARARLVSGHFSYGIHSVGHRGAFAYVTTLQDPVSRVVSWWNWSIQMGKVRARAPAAAAFDDFVWDDGFPIGGFQKSNHMTRVLCNQGTGLIGGVQLFGESVKEDTPLARLAEVTLEHYECALKNLQSFALVFDGERNAEVEALTPLISRLFNAEIAVGPVKGTDLNPTWLDESAGMVVRTRLSEATAAKLIDLNKWDALLYDQARRLHEISVAREVFVSASGRRRGAFAATFWLPKGKVYEETRSIIPWPLQLRTQQMAPHMGRPIMLAALLGRPPNT
ncbi:hypothetical protein KFL_000090180 [Klebsormidium nitens]|uniref:Uncharacterized protein n=1 Tax=Klebsormidium nitens TaxID=105231 RepID=A0A1Y1HI79_KLENI|nr:hypothetical protein KFL_000090180 [Klebsormidium nitens]|eukprot:GAQ78174.1 hypothetical protein KFL_000090180 [Klebsormidium nitens]